MKVLDLTILEILKIVMRTSIRLNLFNLKTSQNKFKKKMKKQNKAKLLNLNQEDQTENQNVRTILMIMFFKQT